MSSFLFPERLRSGVEKTSDRDAELRKLLNDISETHKIAEINTQVFKVICGTIRHYDVKQNSISNLFEKLYKSVQ